MLKMQQLSSRTALGLWSPGLTVQTNGDIAIPPPSTRVRAKRQVASSRHTPSPRERAEVLLGGARTDRDLKNPFRSPAQNLALDLHSWGFKDAITESRG